MARCYAIEEDRDNTRELSDIRNEIGEVGTTNKEDNFERRVILSDVCSPEDERHQHRKQ